MQPLTFGHGVPATVVGDGDSDAALSFIPTSASDCTVMLMHGELRDHASAPLKPALNSLPGHAELGLMAKVCEPCGEWQARRVLPEAP